MRGTIKARMGRGIGRELDRLAPLAHLLRMLIKPALVSVIGGLAAAPAAVLRGSS